MKYHHLKLNVSETGVATVTLSRPEVHNAFDDKLIAELAAVFTALDSNREVRLAVLRGEGKSFSAGGDLKWMKAMKGYSYDENWKDSSKLAEMFERINHFSKPLIATVQGNALGGGAGLCAVCDYVIAEKSAVFGFTEVRIGIVPAVISPYVIAKIGESNARAYFISGMRFDAETALRMHLVHNVVDGMGALELALAKIVEEFLKAGPLASRNAKRLIHDVVRLSFETDHEGRQELRNHTIGAIAELRVSREGQEGMSALLEGRPAEWAGKKIISAD